VSFYESGWIAEVADALPDGADASRQRLLVDASAPEPIQEFFPADKARGGLEKEDQNVEGFALDFQAPAAAGQRAGCEIHTEVTEEDCPPGDILPGRSSGTNGRTVMGRGFIHSRFRHVGLLSASQQQSWFLFESLILKVKDRIPVRFRNSQRRIP
jgi:hypothetical protein